MTDETRTPAIDYDLERYRIRFGLYKILFGTALVGLAGVLVPGAVEYWKLHFENQRRSAEVQLAQINSQQAYVKDFLQTALNQDVELRIRFADYFAQVAADPFKKDWTAFRDSLMSVRDRNRDQIHAKEASIRKALADENPDVEKQAVIAQLERELEWLYREIGYVPKDRSIVRSKSEKADIQLGSAQPTTLGHLPITYSREIVDRILKAPGVPYPATSRPNRATDGRIRGIVLHYAFAPDSSVRIMRDGRPDVRGPLAHWAVLSDGTIEFVAPEEDKANHIGQGGLGLTNTNTIAIETTGQPAFANELQIENLVRLVADVAARWSVPTDMIMSHAEVAPTRKVDMLQQAPAVREMVEAVRTGRAAQQAVPADRPAAAPRR